jgi:ABC-2 type transport system ATP-binding protein
MIAVAELRKHYRIARHHRGLRGALRNLVETRSDVVRAVDGISFRIEDGEFVGFVGPNGAGKSTTLKMLTGVLEPSSGVCQVDGLEPRRDRLRHTARIGVVFGQRTQLWWDLPVIESYILMRHIYRVSRGEFECQLERLVTLLEIGPLLDVPVRKLSLGQRMRCELAAALLHAPALLFLDEPTIGLDAVAKETIRSFLKAENQERKTTILLTTHDLADVERLCPRMILIDHGRALFDGRVSELRRRVGQERLLRVDFAGKVPQGLPAGVEEEERTRERLVLRFRPDMIAAPALIAWLSERAAVTDLVLEEVPIERIVARIYRGGMAALAADSPACGGGA